MQKLANSITTNNPEAVLTYRVRYRNAVRSREARDRDWRVLNGESQACRPPDDRFHTHDISMNHA